MAKHETTEHVVLTVAGKHDRLGRPFDIRLASLLRIAGRSLALRVVAIAPEFDGKSNWKHDIETKGGPR